MAENEDKSNISVMVFHQKLVDPSFQPESAFFHCIVKYKIHPASLSTPETAIFS